MTMPSQPMRSSAWRMPSTSWAIPSLTLSPDGRYVLYYTIEKDTVRSIFALTIDGARETLIERGRNQSKPIWSSDGDSLLFVDGRTGSLSIWRIAVEEGKAKGAAELVKADVGRIELLGMTRNGSLYYVPLGTQRNNVYAADLSAGNEAPRVAIEQFINNNGASSLSADGQYLAYYSRNGAQALPVLKVRSMTTGGIASFRSGSQLARSRTQDACGCRTIDTFSHTLSKSSAADRRSTRSTRSPERRVLFVTSRRRPMQRRFLPMAQFSITVRTILTIRRPSAVSCGLKLPRDGKPYSKPENGSFRWLFRLTERSWRTSVQIGHSARAASQSFPLREAVRTRSSEATAG
jgi:hypothetical protein